LSYPFDPPLLSGILCSIVADLAVNAAPHQKHTFDALSNRRFNFL